MAYALYRDDRRVSKAHSTREAAIIEAVEAGAVTTSSGYFAGDLDHGWMLADGYEIRET